jgi:hypothetical protein
MLRLGSERSRADYNLSETNPVVPSQAELLLAWASGAAQMYLWKPVPASSWHPMMVSVVGPNDSHIPVGGLTLVAVVGH